MTKAKRRTSKEMEPEYVVVIEIEQHVPRSGDDLIGSESRRIVGKMLAIPKVFKTETDARYYAKRLSKIDPKEVSQWRRAARKMGLLRWRTKRSSS